MEGDLRDAERIFREFIDRVHDALPRLRELAQTDEDRALLADLNTQVQYANRAFGMVRIHNEAIRRKEQRTRR